MTRRRRNKKKAVPHVIGNAKATHGRTVKVKHRQEKACTTRNPKPISWNERVEGYEYWRAVHSLFTPDSVDLA